MPRKKNPYEAEATVRLLANLAPHEWARPESLDPALKIFCFGGKIQPAEKILREGWELGLFSRLKLDSALHYRLAPNLTSTAFDLPLEDSPAWVRCVRKGRCGAPQQPAAHPLC